LADTRAQAFRQVTGGGGDFDYAPAWSRDGSLFVARVGSVTSGIWKIDPASGDGTQLLETASALCGPEAPCSGASQGAIVPSPSGELLAFREPRFGLSVLDPATRGLTKVLEPGMRADAAYQWSKDGAALLYLRQATASSEDAPDLVRFEMASRATTLVEADVRSFDLLIATP